MAADVPKKMLKDEITCSLCLKFFTDPVMLECGHNFCKSCIVKCLGEPPAPTAFCPQCQETVHWNTLWPNKQLGNIVGIVRELNDQVMKEAEEWGVCERHQEPLKFFCRDDEALLCVVCSRFKRHQEHHVVLVEAEAEVCKGQIYICVENLREEKELFLACKETVEKQSQCLLNIVEKERQRILAAFRLVRQFLEEEEKLHLAKMEEVDQEIAMKRDEGLAPLLEEIASLENNIQMLEEKCESPPGDLLKDIKSTLKRCVLKRKEKVEHPVTLSPALKWRIWELWDISPVFEKAMEDVEGYLKNQYLLHKENVTLDPGSAHPRLLVSEDGKCLTWSDKPQSLPHSNWRFVRHQGVLGSKWFTSGRHYWEVDVGGKDGWAVGVCVFPCQHDKGPEEGVWAIGKWDGEYRALISPSYPVLLMRNEPTKIRVLLNYTGHRVAFFDANTAVLLHICSIPAHHSFTYYPFFGLWSKCCLRLDP